MQCGDDADDIVQLHAEEDSNDGSMPCDKTTNPATTKVVGTTVTAVDTQSQLTSKKKKRSAEAVRRRNFKQRQAFKKKLYLRKLKKKL